MLPPPPPVPPRVQQTFAEKPPEAPPELRVIQSKLPTMSSTKITVSSSTPMPMLPPPPPAAKLPLPPPPAPAKLPPKPVAIRVSPSIPLPPVELVPEVVQVGELRGRACAASSEVVRIPFPIEHRAKLSAKVECDLPALTVQGVRGSGNCVEVPMAIDSRRSGSAAFHLTVDGVGKTVECEGNVVVERPAPYILGLQTVCGGQISAECPIQEEFWAKKPYKAFFEPKIKEFWISQGKGFIEAGSKVFPFRVFFAPKDPRPVETILVVECGDMEITVKVCGSTGGFQGRRWGERKH
jgi:hypothetical protein